MTLLPLAEHRKTQPSNFSMKGNLVMLCLLILYRYLPPYLGSH